MLLYNSVRIIEMFLSWYHAMRDVMVFHIDDYTFSIYDILKAGLFFGVLAKGIKKLFGVVGLFDDD